MKAFSYLLLFSFLLWSCQTEKDDAQIIGNWQGVAWAVDGQLSDRDVSSVQFNFETDGTYSAQFGSQLEEGKFRLAGDQLFTTAEGMKEKMVRLSKVTPDTIVMDMNRQGVAEELTLVKK
ncbi:MAG: hypothetical protein MRY78_15440 [Saprospiraceae bacterium]|nr:hypothetical protein [Saprospiraceae bacterium]